MLNSDPDYRYSAIDVLKSSWMQAFYPSILEELEAYSNMNHNISANALNNLKKNMGDKNSSFKSIKSRSSVAKSDQDDSLSVDFLFLFIIFYFIFFLYTFFLCIAL